MVRLNGAIQRVYDLTHRASCLTGMMSADPVSQTEAEIIMLITVRVAGNIPANSGWQITIG